MERFRTFYTALLITLHGYMPCVKPVTKRRTSFKLHPSLPIIVKDPTVKQDRSTPHPCSQQTPTLNLQLNTTILHGTWLQTSRAVQESTFGSGWRRSYPGQHTGSTRSLPQERTTTSLEGERVTFDGVPFCCRLGRAIYSFSVACLPSLQDSAKRRHTSRRRRQIIVAGVPVCRIF